MSVQPDATRKGLIDALIVGLKADGLWTKLGSLFLYAAHDAQAGRVNAVNPSNVASAINSPTFTTDRGYAGDGSTSYIDTGVLDATGPHQQDDASMGAWANTSGGSSLLWWNTNINRLIANSEGRLRAAVGGALSGTAVAGFSAVSRTGPTSTAAYYNGVQKGTSATTSTAPSAVSLFSHRGSSGSFSTTRIASVFTGAGLSAAEHANLYSRLNTYLTALGAN